MEVATTSGNKSYYAYWVEDEGVKTDLSWYEVPTASTGSDDDRACPGTAAECDARPNYWLTSVLVVWALSGMPMMMVALGLYRHGVMGAFQDDFYDDMEKALSLRTCRWWLGHCCSQELAQGRPPYHEFNNRGVLADVKQGGLRRDLTLAFEMDGDADVISQSDATRLDSTSRRGVCRGHGPPGGTFRCFGDAGERALPLPGLSWLRNALQ